MKCEKCGSNLKDSFKYCPECGERLAQSQDTDGKSRDQHIRQGKARGEIQPDPDPPSDSSQQPGTQEVSDPCLTPLQSDSKNRDRENATRKSDKDPLKGEDDTSLSSLSTSVPVRDISSFQPQATASSGLPNAQSLPETECNNVQSKILESENSCQLLPLSPSLKTSSPAISSQSSEEPGFHKQQTSNEHAHNKVASFSSEGHPLSSLKSDKLSDNQSSTRQNDLLTDQSAMQDKNNVKQPPCANEALKNTTSEMPSSHSDIEPVSNKGNTDRSDLKENDLSKAQAAELKQNSSVPLHSSDYKANERKNSNAIPVTTGQSGQQTKMFGPYPADRSDLKENDLAKAQAAELKQNSSVPLQSSDYKANERKNSNAIPVTTGQSGQQTKMFGPYPAKEETTKSNIDDKQQTTQKQEKQNTKTPQQVSSKDKPLTHEKGVSSDRNDEAGFQEVSNKKKKDKQNQASIPQQESKDLTIFFHAILSKDFKLDPSKDFVTVRSGALSANWNQDIVKMQISRDLGQHGFIVHGKLQTAKKHVGKCIPYKYVIHKQGNNSNHLEYEYIYKEHSSPFVNRCLLIEEKLLTQQGEWHQYDDIICAKPEEGTWQKITNLFVNVKPDLVKGRNIAGHIMLETIYDMLRDWNEINVRNFFDQLDQFFQTYSRPRVYEDHMKLWSALQYGEEQVKGLLKNFIHNQAQQQALIPNHISSGVIFLLVCDKYDLKMDPNIIGWLVSLPNLRKEEFCTAWSKLLQPLQKECVAHAVRTFCQFAISRTTTNWITIIPLLHLLEGVSKPFEPTSCKIGLDFNDWAGLKGLKFQDPINPEHRWALLKVMESYRYLTDIDPLLVRSWMCVLGLNGLLDCSAVVSVDILDVLTMFSFRLHSKVSYLDHEKLKLVFLHLSNKIKEQPSRYQDTEYCELCQSKAVDVLGKICKLYKEAHRYDVPLECLKLLVLIADFKECLSEQGPSEAKRSKTTEVFLRIQKEIRDWLRLTFQNRLLTSHYSCTNFTSIFEVEVWSKLMSLRFANPEFNEKWKMTFLSQFEGKLKEEKPIHQIDIYCNKVEEVASKYPVLSSSLENCALEAVASLCQGGYESALFEKLRHDLSKFGNLVSAVVLKAWPKTADGKIQDGEELVVKHLLTWPAASKIFQMQGVHGKLVDQLTDEARELIAMASSAFSSAAEKFIRGTITVNFMNQIRKSEDTFLKLLKIDGLCADGRCKDDRAVRKLLRKRNDEIDNVYDEKEMIACLVNACHTLQKNVKVDMEDLEMKHQVSVEQIPLDEFMEVHQLDGSTSEVTGVVTFFNLCNSSRKMAKGLRDLRDSCIFTRCWENQIKELIQPEQEDDDIEPQGIGNTVSLTLDLVFTKIFEPCYAQYKNIYDRVSNGTINLQEVDSVFKVYKGKYDDLNKDLEIMCRINPKDGKRWIKRRVQQIQQYHDLGLAAKSAETIMHVKECLCPKGNFTILDKLLEVSKADFKEESLDFIDDNLISAKELLADITEPRRQCLQELEHRRNFVQWVKVALEDITQLKVFVDLATISAGENAMDVDRVACFHDAVLGYSSMLYGLNIDSDFNDFKRALDKLWQALKTDSNITEKLQDSARHLHWLKTVKESHGSVELSSLSLATAINTKGIYTISALNQKKICMETVLRLDVSEEHDGGEEIRHYSLEDVRDLQNKLMLMSGKVDQNNEVERFTEVFDHVQRLAGTFIDLLSAGNPLFRQWEAQIGCSGTMSNPNPLSDPGILIDFNLDSSQDKILIEGSATEQLPELCKKKEKYLSDWRKFMDKQRSEYYYLNYYTAEQIVYLCEQLSLKNLNEDLEDCALMMLSFINPKCTTYNVWQTWNRVCADKENVGTENSLVTEQSLNESLEDTHDGLKLLDIIWEKYVTDMKSFLPDALDVSSLGRLLDRLNKAVKYDSEDEDQEEIMPLGPHERPIIRELPKGLVPGRPNLIVCPNKEVLASCISVYCASEYEPLPTFDEVLLCSPTTPYEYVELFLRRCLTDGYEGEKIYCLLYADLLSYEVSHAMEQLFHKLNSGSKKDYKLVIICSSDREHAYIPSAFSQYKLQMIPRESLDRVQAYLSRHYTISLASAASVFKDKQSVGIVSSKRAGVGKSLYIQRLYEKLEASERPGSTCLRHIRLFESVINENAVLQSLFDTPKQNGFAIFHIDVTTSVQKGLNEFLFKLLVLGYLMDAEGRMWKRSSQDLYIIEMLQSTPETPRVLRVDSNAPFTFTDVFPKVQCRPPKEVLELEMQIANDPTIEIEDPLMDDECFRSEAYQRPYQYLKRFYEETDLDSFTFCGVEGSHAECLQMFFIYCGIVDPSWAELRNFAWFLNLQLKDCETSIFCNMDIVGDTLRGFRKFVVDFMILMARDFATPSLSISDQSPGRQFVHLEDANEEDLAPFRIRKRWESEPHPYIFFNDDHESMTFIGFHLQPNNHKGVDAIDPSTNQVIKKNIMTMQLYNGLRHNRVPFNVNFDGLPRAEKIEILCSVLGVKWPLDPDESYQLTMDNILKMMAIHMRFRCGIPVIIMGETGCGKTRLIKFLCELQRSGIPAENMQLVKVHGGTTSDFIYSKLQEAETLACLNKENHDLNSVIFFDEANTTEAISCIKEVLCDNTVQGHELKPQTGLQVIAACNPYRKHSDTMIERLEGAGLGYVVKADQTQEKLGSIPLRQLVYRVHALPPSMIPLVWDFGQLNDNTEKMYIHQIVQSMVENESINEDYVKMMTDILSESQCYMRKRKDERSFVSLRDVERCMQVFLWFYTNSKMLFEELKKLVKIKQKESKRAGHVSIEDRDPVQWALLMAVAVCYHSSLESKKEFWHKLCRFFSRYNKPKEVLQEISLMQDLFLHDVPLSGTIAKNKALKENVFLMVVCIELRIPLFLVGKPGSSKSLSKTLVADAMQGQAAHSELYKRLKQIHLTSYQCSPHSTAEGIINTFKQCARFQEGKNLKDYVSVVVLDEIGLAEDSPKMPLKTLHPLLEEGCIDDDRLPHKKVGFIGISNWALDPAKMNRGIFVSRGDPDQNELIKTAEGICSLKPVLKNIHHLFRSLAVAYLKVCSNQEKGFFGLRDYYSLIKMICAVSKDSNPSSEQIVDAVLRNFSGLDNVNALELFCKELNIRIDSAKTSTINLVKQNISGVAQDEDCRYLLILTKNFAGLQILEQNFFSENNLPEIIFGSSFPKDQEYTQVCKNINRVKICMETGQTVVLLNLQNLYESLYDALNQYYVFLGGQKYVDLGLGTHRVKCRVHKDFRLIVIEEKEVVYHQFPIPLINRLEKHYLDISSVLNEREKEMVKLLENWVKRFVSLNSLHSSSNEYFEQDVFIGYHSDTCSSVVLQVMEKVRNEIEDSEIQDRVLEEAKLVLLNCATPDSVVRLEYTDFSDVETERLMTTYFKNQTHHSLAGFVASHIQQGHRNHFIFTEVTTFSRLLTAADVEQLQDTTGVININLLSLRQFETEFSFLKKIRQFLDKPSEDRKKLLLVQMDFIEDSMSANLLASARYSSMNEIIRSKHLSDCRVFVYFITKLPRMEGGTSYTGFQGGHWMSVHIDDLRSSQDIVSDVQNLKTVSISDIFVENISETQETEVEESGPVDMEIDEYVSERTFDTTSLVRSCVQSAVSMLRDEEDSGSLSTRRVDILLTLLDNADILRVKFTDILKGRLHLLLKARDENADRPKNWVSREASNIEALQEGGTFKHTLWRRVQKVVTPLLAHLISVIDRNCNLDLLLDSNCEDEIKNLWLTIFADKGILDMAYVQIDQSSESQNIVIKSRMLAGRTLSCAMPFSWKIKDLLDDLWIFCSQQEGRSYKQFEEVFKRTVIGAFFESLDKKMQREFFQRYLQDFIALTMKVSNAAEQELLHEALVSCVNELCRLAKCELSLPLVHVAYHEFQKRLQNFSRMLSILPEVILSLKGNPQVKDTSEMILDVYAALACLEHLEPRTLNVDFQRQSWLKQVKKLQVPIELVCSEHYLKLCGDRTREIVRQIHNGWRRVFTLSLFVEHILVGIEAENERLGPLVMKCTHHLGKVLDKNSDLKSEKTFVAVIDILRSCKQEAVDLIFKFGLQSCSICRMEPQDPVELPCNHIFCLPCIRRWLIPGQMYCAFCTQPVPDDFDLKASEDVRACLNMNARFRKRCDAFFIEVVSTVCFKDNCPPSRGVILQLLSFLMFEAKPDTLVQAQSHMHTKALSPFDECLDRNPIVRSVVLKLLLKYSFDNVKEYLEQHLLNIIRSKILEGTDKTELYNLYINCFEDSMVEKMQQTEEQTQVQENRNFLQYYMQAGEEAVDNISIETLQQIARLRICLDMGAQLIVAKPACGRLEKHKKEFLLSLMDLCEKSGNDWYRVYIIRKICSLHGVDVVQDMRKEAQFQWLFPEEILQQEEVGGQMDQYLVYGEEYKTVREAVAKAVIEGTVQYIDEALEKCSCAPRKKALYILLSLFREVTTLFRETNPLHHPKPQQCQVLEDFISGSKYLVTREMKTFANALVNNRLASLNVHADRPNTDHTLIELSVHLKAVLLCGVHGILGPLARLGLFPATMLNAFIPTMPEDMLDAARKAIGFTWYYCPNGHPCVVDRCGRPTEVGRCLECGAGVGGQNHVPLSGFHQVQQQGDRTQTGHILGDPQRRDNPDALDTKSLSLTPFTLVRMITHLAMLLEASEQPQSHNIAQIIKPAVQDPCRFVIGHLVKDLEQLGRALGKGADDTVATAHLMLTWTLEAPQTTQWPAAYDNALSTKEARNAWELAIAQNVITPNLKELEQKLKKVNDCIRGDSRVSSNPILKLMRGDPRLFVSSLSWESVLHSSVVWSCREKVSLLSLTHIVEQNDGKSNFPLLWRFLQKETEFRLVRFLPDILALQRNLVKKFQNLPDLISGTVRDFIDKYAGSQKSWYEKRIQIFLNSWNQLRASLSTYELNVPGDYCRTDLDLGCELQVLVPRRQGAGICATAVLSYLVSLHNRMVSAASKQTGEEDSSYNVSLAEVSELHMIRYEVEWDLLPLLLANCQYSMERGCETVSEYDLPKIQQQILTRFLQGKPHITLTEIPTLISRQDQNYENIFKDIKEKVAQEPLTSLRASGLVTELQSLSDVCEALTAVEVSLGFLAMTGGDENMSLEEYLEIKLQMGSHTAAHILKTLGRCCLKHCVALWQLLTSLKSEHMLRLKRDPFSGVPVEYQKALGEAEKKLLVSSLSKCNLEVWLLEMHEFLLLTLKTKRAADTYRPDWSIKDTLSSYMERKNLSVPQDVEEAFPDQILLSQLAETWKFMVTNRPVR